MSEKYGLAELKKRQDVRLFLSQTIKPYLTALYS